MQSEGSQKKKDTKTPLQKVLSFIKEPNQTANRTLRQEMKSDDDRKAGSYWLREVCQSVIGCHWRSLIRLIKLI